MKPITINNEKDAEKFQEAVKGLDQTKYTSKEFGAYLQNL